MQFPGVTVHCFWHSALLADWDCFQKGSQFIFWWANVSLMAEDGDILQVLAAPLSWSNSGSRAHRFSSFYLDLFTGSKIKWLCFPSGSKETEFLKHKFRCNLQFPDIAEHQILACTFQSFHPTKGSAVCHGLPFKIVALLFGLSTTPKVFRQGF